MPTDRQPAVKGNGMLTWFERGMLDAVKKHGRCAPRESKAYREYNQGYRAGKERSDGGQQTE